MLIDTHAHLYWEDFKKDLDQVIKRSIDKGVTTVINVGVDVNLSKKALRQAQGKLSEVSGLTAYSTIGIHPHEAIKYYDGVSIHKDIEELEKLYHSKPDQTHPEQDRRIIAIGECGLDFFFQTNLYPTSLSGDQQKVLQRRLFQAQIDLAKKLNLPLLVHCRDDRSKNPGNSEAWDEVIKMIGNHPAILHCYSGLISTTNYILQTTNLLVSFAANITYPKNGYLREAVKILPLNKICFETDSPFLAPQSKRGQRNEPSTVEEIAQLVAELKGISFGEAANQTTGNVKKFLKIS